MNTIPQGYGLNHYERIINLAIFEAIGRILYLKEKAIQGRTETEVKILDYLNSLNSKDYESLLILLYLINSGVVRKLNRYVTIRTKMRKTSTRYLTTNIDFLFIFDPIMNAEILEELAVIGIKELMELFIKNDSHITFIVKALVGETNQLEHMELDRPIAGSILDISLVEEYLSSRIERRIPPINIAV